MADESPEISSSRTELSFTDPFEVHRHMVIALFTVTFVVACLLAAGLLTSTVTISMVVVVAGAMGGFVSALRRLYTFERVFPVNFLKKPHKIDLYLFFYSMIPSLVGAIAAIVLYLIFASELITGDIFPRFHHSSFNREPNDFRNFVANWEPMGPSDYAKTLVWGFLAGFSERFVPDVLERLANSKQENDKS